MRIRNEHNDQDDLFYGPIAIREDVSDVQQTPREDNSLKFPSSPDAEKIRVLSSDLEFLRRRHAAEIKRWVEYDRRIKQWRAEVLRVVSWLRKQVAERREIESELDKYKNLVRLKDQEIERLRAEKA